MSTFIQELYSDEVAVLNASDFQLTNGPIFFDEIVCSGEEDSLLDCQYDRIHRCSHENDVAIICHRELLFFSIIIQ